MLLRGLAVAAAAAAPGIVAAHSLAASDHAPAGVMFEHAHAAGGWMAGVRYLDETYSGVRSGSRPISDAALVELGYHSRAGHMDMRMAMFELMYAPTDRLTLMLMPQYMWMDMGMVALASHGGEPGGGHGHGDGAHRDHVAGWGDTQMSGIWRLHGDAHQQWLLTATLSAPTGKVDIRGSDGRYAHYGMQLGSGTWDFLPGMTYVRRDNAWSAGVQVGLIRRLEDQNASGFRLGDGWNGTVWAAWSPSPRWSLSTRLAYKDIGKIEGHYNGAHNHAAPEDFQRNYGGRLLEGGLGVNTVLGRTRVGLEWQKPLRQDVNGQQLGKDRSLWLSVSQGW
ncbi:hypothetical protein [Tahibacter amnicola]|uniref:Transporter n=1 Tax=Tahibacter amnicola TaxID=2976241 RepID=A0ABY6BKY4_9GAMM|nr:hypothetical protein [Tahibacter amnicola]UXI69695.1 hypothetical protein N4264_08705 [Tahibacter amnicola]